MFYMVQIVENQAEVEGVVQSIKAHAALPGYQQVEIALEKSREIKDFPNLAKNDEGKTVMINMKTAQLHDGGFAVGQAFRAVIRKATATEYFLK
jgi:hypothetical protein